jgi:hypothetical protein
MTYRLGKCVEDSLYRYSLAVETDAAGAKSLVIVQCNPSLASSTRSDPTVGKVSTWAEETGFASVVFLNLFARRSPNVAEISQLPYADLVGPRNDEVLTRYSSTQATVVFAWGATLPVPDDLYQRRLLELHDIFASHPIFCVGALSAGHYPRHGRMWNNGNRSLRPLSWNELLPNNSIQRTRYARR